MGLLTIGMTAVRVTINPSDPTDVQVRPDLGAGQTDLKDRGIIIQVEIGVDNLTAEALRQQGLPVPPTVPCDALVDTGASNFAIDLSIARQLGLSRTGTTNQNTAGGTRTANLYAISLDFPGTSLNNIDVLVAMDCVITGQPFRCVIGRDIMSKWHMHYNGTTGTITIAD